MRKFCRVSGLLVAALFAQQAAAHAHLKTQSPAASTAVATSPQALTLTFSEDIEPAFSGVELIAADKQPVTLGKAQRDAKMHNQLIVPLEKPLTSGSYQVNWHVLSVDGHKTKGNYSFSVK